jgi:hypothetical protein
MGRLDVPALGDELAEFGVAVLGDRRTFAREDPLLDLLGRFGVTEVFFARQELPQDDSVGINLMVTVSSGA